MNAKEFKEKFGRPPENDDLHRVNCDQAGEPGHTFCGICFICGRPRFECGGVMGHIAQPAPVPTIFGGGEVPAFRLEFLYDEVRFNFTDEFLRGGLAICEDVWKLLIQESVGRIKNDINRRFLVGVILQFLQGQVEAGNLRGHNDAYDSKVWLYMQEDGGQCPT